MRGERLDHWRSSRAIVSLIAPVQIALDVVAWTIAHYLAVWGRYDFTWQLVPLVKTARLAAIVGAAQVVAGLALGLYRRRWRYGSFDEVLALVRCGLVTGTSAFAISGVLGVRKPLPRSVPFTTLVLALAGMAAVRYTWRLSLERLRRPIPHEARHRAVVVGAGEGGAQLIRALQTDPRSEYAPVAIVDDDPKNRRLHISGVPVLGVTAEIGAIARRREADTLLVAIPSASAELIGRLTDTAAAADLSIKVLPPMSDFISRPVSAVDVRDVKEEDLLGRHQVDTNLQQIAGYLEGRRVLVTGAGGSIGSELCRQIAPFRPSELMMLDRDESALHGLQLSMLGRALLDDPSLLLADIRDAHVIERLFAERRPEIVFHAAALKHLPLLETHPTEAFKSNVVGTLNVLRAAESAGVVEFVNISTDKAARPASVLGYSKRIAERLTAWYGAEYGGKFLSVRFGNVLGSRGSVLITFRDQIRRGGPVTVTHPDVTRFFMTTTEACQLVVQAGAIGRTGEVLVLDMGEPVRIADVARRLVALQRNKVQITFTGLRPGEKLHEDLLGDAEVDLRPHHHLITHVSAPPLDPSELSILEGTDLPEEKVRELLCRLADADPDPARFR